MEMEKSSSEDLCSARGMGKKLNMFYLPSYLQQQKIELCGPLFLETFKNW